MKRRARRALRALRYVAAQVGALLEQADGPRARRAGAVLTEAARRAGELERTDTAERTDTGGGV